MKIFLRNILRILFHFLLYTLVLGIIYTYFNQIKLKHFPPPNISNSISFNKKSQFIRNNGFINFDILSLGSSMTLRNIYSQSIVKYFKNGSYLNASSWGVNMEENFQLLKIFHEIYSPKYLIIASNLIDFRESEKIFNYNIIKKYLKSRKIFLPYYHLRTFDFNYYKDNILLLKRMDLNPNTYGTLIYDRYGGANFDKNNFIIKDKRWNLNVVDTKIDTLQYSYLDSIFKFCNDKNVSLLFIESPLREGIYKTLGEENRIKLKNHIRKINNISQLYDGITVNTSIDYLNDSLFVDSTHLSDIGALIFTESSLTSLHIDPN